jgi:hypothetical protein
MENKRIIQSIGGIAKEETLYNLTNHIMENTFVLENDAPYPGYHGDNLPTEPVPISVFMMTKKKHSTEHILRLSESIRKYFEHSFDAVPGIICVNNDTFPCIRIRGLDNYELIEELQNCFFSEGVKFMKSKKIRTKAIIQLKKLFNIELFDTDIYKDLDDKNTFYIDIKEQVSWSKFAQLSRNVKNNIDKDKANFDAALGAIYTSPEILDVVRIYGKEMDIAKLKLIQKTYLNELKKME